MGMVSSGWVSKRLLPSCLAIIWGAFCAPALTIGTQINAVVNSASYSAALAPGGLITIFGTNLATLQYQAQSAPLSSQVSGTSVTLNGAALPLLYASSSQINAQLPFTITGNATLQVTTPNGSAQVTVTISDTAPATFKATTGSGPTVTHANGAIVSASAPAEAGEAVSVYLTGLGQVKGTVAAGEAAPSSPPLTALAMVQVQVGGAAPFTPSFAGLAPGFAGLNQVNFQVPQVASGTYSLKIIAGGAAGNAVPLVVHSSIARSSPATVAVVTIDPPNAVIPAGSVQQFTATTTMSDGTTQSVTANATWSSTAASVAAVKAGGSVFAMAQGAVTITAAAGSASASATVTVVPPSAPIRHYEYVFPDGAMYVYDMDNGFNLVKQIGIPQAQGIRGVAASPVTHTLYLSYGGDGGGNGNGSMLAYDLVADKILWTVNYSTGIDSMAITPDGKTIYMPDGEISADSTWNVIDASNGNVTGSIQGGPGPHNTVVSLDGKHVYMGPRGSYYLWVADTSNNSNVHSIGPLTNTVRPFTINGKQTLAFTTATLFLGFEVSDITTGQVLYTMPINGFSVPQDYPASAPSHGISLSPDEKEIWVMDGPNSYVHVFDVTGLPGTAPKQVADLKLSRPMTGYESPCTYDCLRDGWIQHSADGRFVFVGDAGDVFDTSTRQSVVNLDPLYNTRKHLEIDWQNGVPIFTTSRHGLGYVTP